MDSPPPSEVPPVPSADAQHGRGIAVFVGGAVSVLAIAIVVMAALFIRHLPSLPETRPVPEESLAPLTPEEEPEPDFLEQEEPPPPPGQRLKATTNEVDPVERGWQAVVGAPVPLAYDVPQAWTVRSGGTILGFEDGDQEWSTGFAVSKRGVSLVGDREDCHSRPRPGSAGVAEVDVEATDTTWDTATGLAAAWAKNAYYYQGGRPDSRIETSTPYTSHDGLSGHMVVMSVTTQSRQCIAKETEVRVAVIAVPGQKSHYALILLADREGSEAPDPEDLDTMLSTLRLAAQDE